MKIRQVNILNLMVVLQIIEKSQGMSIFLDKIESKYPSFPFVMYGLL